MMNSEQLRAALQGRNLSRVAADTGISYDAIYRFVGRPLGIFDHATLSDYLTNLARTVDELADGDVPAHPPVAALGNGSAKGGK